MRKPFVDWHIEALLQEINDSPLPIDLLLSRYFKNHKSLGANDRRTIGETIFGMVRWKSLLDFFSPKDRLARYRSIDWESVQKDPAIPAYARLGTSPYLYDRFCSAFGKEKGEELCQILNTPAPTAIRANLLKTTPEELLGKWEGKFNLARASHAPAGLVFAKREPLFSLPEFKEGLFEMQDEGSQLVAQAVEAKPGDWVLDYCSGSGGKTLGFAPSMQGKGQIYLHDIRSQALLEARRRLKRAGIQNGQCLPPNHPQLGKLKGRCDWVLADVPCSGTGTLRRNPDQKWKIDAPMIERLKEQQKAIVKEAVRYVKPGGCLVYATCSVLPEENQDQIESFLADYPLALEKEPLSLFPQRGGMDGFYAAIFRKKRV